MNPLKNGADDQLKKGVTEMKQGSTTATKKPRTNFLTGCLGCFGMLVAIAFIAIVVVAIFEDTNEPKEKKTSIQMPAMESTATNGIEEQVQALLLKAIGNTTNTGEPKIVDLQVNDHFGTDAEGDKIVVATLRGNDNLTANMIKGGMQLESIRVFQSLFSIPEIEEVSLLWQFPTKDVNGNSTLTTVLKISLTKATAAKINWEGFDRENFEKVADSYWESPAFREQEEVAESAFYRELMAVNSMCFTKDLMWVIVVGKP